MFEEMGSQIVTLSKIGAQKFVTRPKLETKRNVTPPPSF